MIPDGIENKVLVINDAIRPELLKQIKDDIRKIPREKWEYQNDNPDYTKYRANAEYIYGSMDTDSSVNSHIVKIIHDTLFSKRITNEMKSINDWAFKMIDKTTYDITYVTSHINGKPCGWHNNDSDTKKDIIMSLNYIFHIDMGSDFTGGELDYSYDNIDADSCGWYPMSEPTIHQTIPYKDNQLVIIPTYSWHKVRTIESVNNITEPLDGRITVNGHIGFNLKEK